jgi:hypothetical protein
MYTRQQKFYVFLGTVLFGLVATFNSSNAGFATWILDALLVAAITGFIVVKYLQYKGKWPKRK